MIECDNLDNKFVLLLFHECSLLSTQSNAWFNHLGDHFLKKGALKCYHLKAFLFVGLPKTISFSFFLFHGFLLFIHSLNVISLPADTFVEKLSCFEFVQFIIAQSVCVCVCFRLVIQNLIMVGFTLTICPTYTS